MKSRSCPYRRFCHDAGECESCDFEKAFSNLGRKIKKLKEENAKLRDENDELKRTIDMLRDPHF